MKKIIEEIHKIIKDYRREDLDCFYTNEITIDHIKRWINQFEEKDREFILSHLVSLYTMCIFAYV